MTAGAWRHNVRPPELVSDALRQTEPSFIRMYGDTMYLTIGAAKDFDELAAALSATLSNVETELARPINSMEFKTAIADSRAVLQSLSRSPSPDDVSRALYRFMFQAGRYVVPLRKRASVDATYMERISVGRAPNKDIVLRHSSISKFHAWFEVHDSGTFHVVEAGSKNGTRVNGNRIPAKEPCALQSGDSILFGSVETVLCDARALWRTLHAT